VASAADRLLVFASDAVVGRPAAKLADRAETALAEPGAREALADLAGRLRARRLAAVVEQPAALRAVSRRGRLPWPAAARTAAEGGLARAALAERAKVFATAPGVGPVAHPEARGLLVAFNGMDGAGKSTAAQVARERLEAAGHPASIAWARLGQEGRVQDAIAVPVKRVLGTRGTVADPVAATIGADREAVAHAGGRRHTGAVAWVWTLVVAAINVRALRRAVRRARTGESVVCDRWLADSLVDLRIRYGRHAAAERLLRLLVPRPDLDVLLAIDAQTSLARKPGDQAPEVVERMEPLYDEAAARGRLAIVDARRPQDEVMADVARLVDALAARAPNV
jgi:thymidylate kinase